MKYTKSQLNAIYYSERQRKLDKLGLLDDFKSYNKGKDYLCIANYCKRKNITL